MEEKKHELEDGRVEEAMANLENAAAELRAAEAAEEAAEVAEKVAEEKFEKAIKNLEEAQAHHERSEHNHDQKHEHHGEHVDNSVRVAVVTTSGFFPDQGFVIVPKHQQVRIILAEAAKKLGLTDTSTWIARVNSKEIDPAKTYEENGLTGEVEIDFGPREGGGGDA